MVLGEGGTKLHNSTLAGLLQTGQDEDCGLAHAGLRLMVMEIPSASLDAVTLLALWAVSRCGPPPHRQHPNIPHDPVLAQHVRSEDGLSTQRGSR